MTDKEEKQAIKDRRKQFFSEVFDIQFWQAMSFGLGVSLVFCIVMHYLM